MGNIDLAAAAASKSSGGSYTFLIVIVVLFGLFYFVMIRPQRNKQRQVQQMQRQVMPGQQVRTTAGMYATVITADDENVLLEVAPGVQVRFLRRAVMEVLPDDYGTSNGEFSSGTDEETVAEEERSAEDERSADLPPGH